MDRFRQVVSQHTVYIFQDIFTNMPGFRTHKGPAGVTPTPEATCIGHVSVGVFRLGRASCLKENGEIE